MITQKQFSSTLIKAMGYDKENKQLTVHFQTGISYVYNEVPQEIWDKAIKAESVGKFFHKEIKSIFTSEKAGNGTNSK